MSTTGKDERIAQILETGVTREQLAEVVWSMERDYAGHVELIKELIDERAELRSENAKLRNGVERTRTERATLTVEQVREAVMSADRLEKPMGDTGMTNTYLIIRDDGWQAIADELNATLRRGTCHDVWDVELTGRLRFQCSECNSVSLEITPRFCPVCGREVVDE